MQYFVNSSRIFTLSLDHMHHSPPRSFTPTRPTPLSMLLPLLEEISLQQGPSGSSYSDVPWPFRAGLIVNVLTEGSYTVINHSSAAFWSDVGICIDLCRPQKGASLYKDRKYT